MTKNKKEAYGHFRKTYYKSKKFVRKSIKESTELIRDLKKVVNVALNEVFEDKYTMDFECEGIEPVLFGEKGAGDWYETWANVYTEMMWSSGARPNNKKVAKYIDVDIETTEENAIEEYPNDEDKQMEYMVEQWNAYAPSVRVMAMPRYFTNKNGFQVCDLTLEMRFITYLGAEVGKYEPKLISFSTVSKEEKINPNYVEEDDFEFFEGGYPVDEDVIKEFIRKSIAEYVAEF